MARILIVDDSATIRMTLGLIRIQVNMARIRIYTDTPFPETSPFY